MNEQTTSGEGQLYAGEGQFSIANGSVSIGNDPTVSFQQMPSPSSVSETVLEDEATHPAYMSLMFWAAVIVGILGGLALVAMFALAWNDKAVPEVLGSITQWAVIILGVLLVGDALLGKLAVKA